MISGFLLSDFFHSMSFFSMFLFILSPTWIITWPLKKCKMHIFNGVFYAKYILLLYFYFYSKKTADIYYSLGDSFTDIYPVILHFWVWLTFERVRKNHLLRWVSAIWRRTRDSNPRKHTLRCLSKTVPSTTRPILHNANILYINHALISMINKV